MTKTIAILQARMSSSRLPGKVLRPILGKPMLSHQVARIKHATSIDQLIVATSKEASDLPLVEFCKSEGIECFQGSLNDVLDRFYQTAKAYNGDTIIRLTGDCPLIDAEIIDLAVSTHLKQGNDYTTNSILPDDPNNTFTYADGLDVEVVNFDVLEAIWQSTSEPFFREHVTSYIRKNTDEFKVGYFHHSPNISDFRLTVDEPSDLDLIHEIFNYFSKQGSIFGYRDVIEHIQNNPELKQLNQSHNLFKE